jgi:hypothetical protein
LKLLIVNNNEPAAKREGGNLPLHASLHRAVPVLHPYLPLHLDGYDSFNNEAVNLLSHYVLQSNSSPTQSSAAFVSM